jgi:dihydropteroate synthase
MSRKPHPCAAAGLGFAKARDGNLQLISGLPRLRAALRGALRHAPLLVGPSRKTFLGLVTGAARLASRVSSMVVACCITAELLSNSALGTEP